MTISSISPIAVCVGFAMSMTGWQTSRMPTQSDDIALDVRECTKISITSASPSSENCEPNTRQARLLSVLDTSSYNVSALDDLTHARANVTSTDATDGLDTEEKKMDADVQGRASAMETSTMVDLSPFILTVMASLACDILRLLLAFIACWGKQLPTCVSPRRADNTCNGHVVDVVDNAWFASTLGHTEVGVHTQKKCPPTVEIFDVATPRSDGGDSPLRLQAELAGERVTIEMQDFTCTH